MVIGHWELVIGHWEEGQTGHWALGIEHGAWAKQGMGLGHWALVISPAVISHWS